MFPSTFTRKMLQFLQTGYHGLQRQVLKNNRMIYQPHTNRTMDCIISKPEYG